MEKIVGKLKTDRKIRIFVQWGEFIEDMETQERFAVHQLDNDYVKCSTAFEAIEVREHFLRAQR